MTTGHTTNTFDGYEMACQQALENQGLVPVMEILLENGLPPCPEQTGGFCMVVAVYDDDSDAFVWVTVGDYENTYLVVRYENDEVPFEGPEPAGRHVPLAEIPSAVREYLPDLPPTR